MIKKSSWRWSAGTRSRPYPGACERGRTRSSRKAQEENCGETRRCFFLWSFLTNPSDGSVWIFFCFWNQQVVVGCVVRNLYERERERKIARYPGDAGQDVCQGGGRREGTPNGSKDVSLHDPQQQLGIPSLHMTVGCWIADSLRRCGGPQVISVIGPQSSAKSTLMNYLFGCCPSKPGTPCSTSRSRSWPWPARTSCSSTSR